MLEAISGLIPAAPARFVEGGLAPVSQISPADDGSGWLGWFESQAGKERSSKGRESHEKVRESVLKWSGIEHSFAFPPEH